MEQSAPFSIVREHTTPHRSYYDAFDIEQAAAVSNTLYVKYGLHCDVYDKHGRRWYNTLELNNELNGEYNLISYAT